MTDSVTRVMRAPGLMTIVVFVSALIATGLSGDLILSVVLAVALLTAIAGGFSWGSDRKIDLTEQMLFGLTVVFGLITLSTIVAGGTRSMLGLSTLVLLVTVGFYLRYRGRHGTEPIDHEALLVLMLITLVSLVTKMWFFMTPLAVAVAVVVLWSILRRRNERLGSTPYAVGVMLVVVGAGFVSRVLAISDRAEGAIFRSYDQYFRASVAHAVIRFGVGDHPGARDYPFRYHWLSEASMGLLAEIGPSTALEMVLRFSALGAIFATALAVHVLAREIGLNRFEGYFVAVLMTVLSTLLYSYGLNILKPTEMGQLWGTPLLLVILLLLFRFVRCERVTTAAMLVLAVVVTMMTNSTAGLVAVLTIGAVLGVRIVKARRLSAVTLFLFVLLSLALLTLQQTLLVSLEENSYAPAFSLFQLFDYAVVFGYTGSNHLVAFSTVVALVFIMWFQGGASLGFRHLGVPVKGDRIAHTIFELVAPIGFVLATFVAIGGTEQYRFLLPILVVGPFVAGASLRQSFHSIRLEHRGILIALVVAGLVLGGLASRFMSKAFGGAEFMAPRLGFVALLFLIPIGLWGASRMVRRRSSGATDAPKPHLAPFFLAMSVVVGVAHTVNETRGQYAYALGLEAQSAKHADRFACLEALRRASPVDAVIASNMWKWEDDAATEKWYIATAVAERRSYLDGPLYVQNPRSDWLQDRADLTMRFASTPSPEDFRELRSFNVEYFVADKERSTTSSWEGYGSVIFSNDTCDVVRLNEDAS